MGKLFGIILIVLAVWVGVEVYDKGVDHAFGGLFAWFGQPIQPLDGPEAHGAGADTRPITQRVRERVTSDIARGAQRDGAGESDEEDND